MHTPTTDGIDIPLPLPSEIQRCCTPSPSLWISRLAYPPPLCNSKLAYPPHLWNSRLAYPPPLWNFKEYQSRGAKLKTKQMQQTSNRHFLKIIQAATSSPFVLWSLMLVDFLLG